MGKYYSTSELISDEFVTGLMSQINDNTFKPYKKTLWFKFKLFFYSNWKNRQFNKIIRNREKRWDNSVRNGKWN